jgi:hypothetical protein
MVTGNGRRNAPIAPGITGVKPLGFAWQIKKLRDSMSWQSRWYEFYTGHEIFEMIYVAGTLQHCNDIREKLLEAQHMQSLYEKHHPPRLDKVFTYPPHMDDLRVLLSTIERQP